MVTRRNCTNDPPPIRQPREILEQFKVVENRLSPVRHLDFMDYLAVDLFDLFESGLQVWHSSLSLVAWRTRIAGNCAF